MPFFISFLKSAGLFDSWVASCPLHYTSPNAPSRRDVLGTVLLSILASHRRYAHITALRADTVNPPLLAMNKVLSKDAIRRAFEKIETQAGIEWLQEQLDYTLRPLLSEPWILDVEPQSSRCMASRKALWWATIQASQAGRRTPITATWWQISG